MNTAKENRFRLESKIIKLVFEDNNNTVHFDYHVNIDLEKENIRLDLYTTNSRSKEVFLLHQTSGPSSIAVLEKMVDYLKDRQLVAQKNSYTVSWSNLKEENSIVHQSYFYEFSEEEVIRKFFYNKRPEDFQIVIKQNPIS